MLILFILLSAAFSVLILILAFENIAAQCNYLQFFLAPISATTSITFLIFGVAFLGIIAGASYAGLVWAIFSKNGNSEDEEDGEY
ncbi:MAG: hypothetical protein UR28_C0029G0046 [Candidatus Peregrinibacteria bacterium GW2011_GWF2_33_10]|nr:MAG: hypothetical protein UR28_C0029G0046 [Candidatus Peregrinibacteria bacterium GW2011_GWF2_33_10]OGJ45408.1 MAG: hypothetical protein A2263_04030 [Candidatus Peregrinibacteria bacterium RIFOXYA2_FULL_33_21]OGJ45529.1 MAG: hypothetical protein A2272_00950 [Candidatus Peregrinibacteria bacterium RIFOXYA12_FULL_33_12]OGJ51011.1 MAG: hypothetical protein A2307_05625 [Candidatus Peregrinibacteria bacterium RIFOXYB2_FULL_33_20]